MFEKLKDFKSIVLWFSSGLDSTLLLAMLREQGINFDIYQQGREFWTKAQKRKADALIQKWDLKVYSYPAQVVSFIGQDDEISAVFEYGVGQRTFPLVRDLVEGTRCIADLAQFSLDQEPIKHDLHILGSRAFDTHWSVTKPPIPSRWWQTGTATFYAPLYFKTRTWVKRELRKRGLADTEATEQENTANLSVCKNCIAGTGKVYCPSELKEIDNIIWNRSQNLNNFRAVYS